MSPQQAIETLEHLRDGPRTTGMTRPDSALASWRAQVMDVFVRMFGPDHHLTASFASVSFVPKRNTLYTSAVGRQHQLDVSEQRGVDRAQGLIDAAMAVLRIPSDSLSDDDLDPILRSKVRALIDAGQWDLVPVTVSVAVESAVRVWAGEPSDDSGTPLTGRALFQHVLADGSPLRLGTGKAEQEGWRFLAFGFVMAVSNAARHRVVERGDIRRYARGILGLATLLLAEFRHQHPELT